MAENKVSDTVNDMVNSMVEDINSAQNGSNKVSAIKDNVGYDMSRVHSANLKILKEIDRICRKYKIQYALDAGTLIGAVRHKGFIPWDDDADIVFTRNQFEAFKKVVRRELPDTMELVEPDSFHGGKAFFDFTPRIIYKKSRMHPDSNKMDYYDGKLCHHKQNRRQIQTNARCQQIRGGQCDKALNHAADYSSRDGGQNQQESKHTVVAAEYLPVLLSLLMLTGKVFL